MIRSESRVVRTWCRIMLQAAEATAGLLAINVRRS